MANYEVYDPKAASEVADNTKPESLPTPPMGYFWGRVELVETPVGKGSIYSSYTYEVDGAALYVNLYDVNGNVVKRVTSGALELVKFDFNAAMSSLIARCQWHVRGLATLEAAAVSLAAFNERNKLS